MKSYRYFLVGDLRAGSAHLPDQVPGRKAQGEGFQGVESSQSTVSFTKSFTFRSEKQGFFRPPPSQATPRNPPVFVNESERFCERNAETVSFDPPTVSPASPTTNLTPPSGARGTRAHGGGIGILKCFRGNDLCRPTQPLSSLRTRLRSLTHVPRAPPPPEVRQNAPGDACGTRAPDGGVRILRYFAGNDL